MQNYQKKLKLNQLIYPKKTEVKLRQTYTIISPRLAIKPARYFHVKQNKRGNKAVKKFVTNQ